MASNKEHVMKKVFAAVVAFAALGLAGCVAVPVGDPYYAPAPGVSINYSTGGYYYGGPHRHWHGHRGWR
jgi:hypothetical protein